MTSRNDTWSVLFRSPWKLLTFVSIGVSIFISIGVNAHELAIGGFCVLTANEFQLWKQFKIAKIISILKGLKSSNTKPEINRGIIEKQEIQNTRLETCLSPNHHPFE